MPDEQTNRAFWAHLTREQKIGFLLLVVFAFLTIGLGALQIRNTFLAPFALSSQVPATIKDDVNAPEALRLRDTDHDALSDFDELYVYGTSPYLYDTFGYGMSDKEVLAKGLPLCPKGQECNSQAVSGVALPSASQSSTAAILSAGDAELNNPPPDLAQILQSPAQIRAMLHDAGVQDDVLKKVSDADLMKMVQETMSSSSVMDEIKALNSAMQSVKP